MNYSATTKLLLFVSHLVLSCQSDEPRPTAYLEANIIDYIAATEIREEWVQNPEALPFINHDVEVVRITFDSQDLEGKTVTGSGAILIPKEVEMPQVISLQHATFFADEEAPSENGVFSVVSRKSIFASNGAIVILPDYLGYGTSKDQVHPYHHAASLSRHSLDMLNASLSYLAEKGIEHEPGITLAGYSEGAYASLALARKIERERPDLNISSISLGSGAYDLLQTFNLFNKQLDDRIGCLPCNGFLIYSYWHIAGRDRPIQDYFRQPYAEQIKNGLFDGGFDSSEIVRVLPATMRELFTDGFLQRIANGQEEEMLKLLTDNNLHEYFPRVTMLIMHGTADTVAPFFNSEQYANQAKDLGRDAQFIPLEGVNHFDGIYAWGLHTMNWLGK